jgi:adenosine kinase
MEQRSFSNLLTDLQIDILICIVKKNKPSILVSGSLAYDEVFIYGGEIREHLPPSLQDPLYINLRAKGPFHRFGGCGGNVAYTLSLFGIQSALSSWLGRDGDRYIDHLRELDVDVKNVLMCDDRNTPAGILLVDSRGDHLLFFGDSGKELELPTPDAGGFSLTVVTAGVPQNMLQLMQHCRDASLPTLVDAGKIIMDVDVQSLVRSIEDADTLVLNRYECDLLIRQSGLTLGSLCASVGTVVVTSGSGDITLHTRENSASFPTVTVEKVEDPSGAGDAFLAGYACGKLKALAPRECIAIAATAASFAVEATGTQGHRFTIDEFMGRLEHTYGVQSFDLSTRPPKRRKNS